MSGQAGTTTISRPGGAEAGHYPQAQHPEPAALAIEAFTNEVHRHA